MDWTAWMDALLSTQIPWLPDPTVMRWGRRLFWGIVLVSLALWVGRRWPRYVQLGVSGALLVWALSLGSMSPVFWLGLAFQTPSLVMALICLVWVGTRLIPGTAYRLGPEQMRALHLAGGVGIVLGWLLLLDTFAVLPISLYALGFSPVAVGLAALVAVFPWVVWGSRHPACVVSTLLGVVLLFYVLLRLPTGNLWDALMDPWLWVALQADWLWRGLRRLRGHQS